MSPKYVIMSLSGKEDFQNYENFIGKQKFGFYLSG